MRRYRTHGLLLSPILAKAQRATWNGQTPQHKTQTRRNVGLELVNEKPDDWRLIGYMWNHNDKRVIGYFEHKRTGRSLYIDSPYGGNGDLIYFKERHYVYGAWRETSELTSSGRFNKWVFRREKGVNLPVLFDNDPPLSFHPKGVNRKEHYGYYERPFLYMPKEYAQLWAIQKDPRIQRLCNISDKDACHEGIEPIWSSYRDRWVYKNYQREQPTFSPRTSFLSLFAFINGEEAKNKNPWVWVLDFVPISHTGRPSDELIQETRRDLHTPRVMQPEFLGNYNGGKEAKP